MRFYATISKTLANPKNILKKKKPKLPLNVQHSHWACALDKEKEEKGKERGASCGCGAVVVAALFINRPHLCRQRCNGFGNRVAPQAATIDLFALARIAVERA